MCLALGGALETLAGTAPREARIGRGSRRRDKPPRYLWKSVGTSKGDVLEKLTFKKYL